MVIRRATNICASLVIVAFSVLAGGAGGASSAVPSPIDPAMLPEDGPPAPPQPTEQRTLCVPAVAGGDGADIPRSQRDLGFDSVWPITRGAGQRIAVIDTGVSRHPRLPSLDGGGDYVGTSDGTDDCDAHGTVVAGLIAAQQVEGSGFSGAAPDAQIISIRQSSAAFSVAGQREDPAVAENSSGTETSTPWHRPSVTLRTWVQASSTSPKSPVSLPGGTGSATNDSALQSNTPRSRRTS